MAWIDELDNADQAFIRNLVLESGSLKSLAALYDVSYPTIRLRLDRLQEKIKLSDDDGRSPFERKIMQLVIDERIDYDTAELITMLYKKDSEV